MSRAATRAADCIDRFAASLFLKIVDNGRAQAIADQVGDVGGDQFRTQRVLVEPLGILLLDRLREIAGQLLSQVRIGADVAVDQLIEQAQFAVGQ